MYKWHACRHRERETHKDCKDVSSKWTMPTGKKKQSAWKAQTALSWRQKSAQRTTWEQLTMSLLQGPGMKHGQDHWENLSFYPLKANVSNGNKPCLEDLSLITHVLYVFCACVFAFLAVRRISWEHSAHLWPTMASQGALHIFTPCIWACTRRRSGQLMILGNTIPY